MGWQVLFLVTWPVAGIAITRWLRSHLAGSRMDLAKICVAYFVSLVFFAHGYYVLYMVNPKNFSFAEEVRSSRRQEIIASEEQQVAQVVKLSAAANQLLRELNEGHMALDVSLTDSAFVEVRTLDYRFEFEFDPSWSGFKAGRRFRAARVAIKDTGGNRLGSEFLTISGPDPSQQSELSSAEWDSVILSYFPPRRAEQYVEMLLPLQERLQSSLRRLTTEVSRPLSEARQQEWGFIEFLYFSTITQTTVGYGDILPNSSIVRCVVIGQVLLALILLGFAISWVTSGAGPPQVDSLVVHTAISEKR